MRFDEFRAAARSTQSYPGYIEKLFSEISIWPSYLLARTSATPNQITLVSTLLAFGGAALVQSSVYSFRVGGVVLWFVAYILDFCDGDIARYKQMKSEFGHWVEAISDRAKDMVLLAAVTYFEFGQLRAPWIIWVGSLALGGTIIHSYAITYGFKANKPFSASPLARFEGIHNALLALCVILNYLQIYLLFVAVTSLGSTAFNVYSTWKAYSSDISARTKHP